MSVRGPLPLNTLDLVAEWLDGMSMRDAFLLVILEVSLLAPLHAGQAAPWVDEAVVMRLLDRWTLWEILTVLPTRQPHLPTWYAIAEVAGLHTVLAMSILSLPVTAYATYRLGCVVDGPVTGFGAAALIAASPFLAVQASWLRMYAPLTALLSVGLWLGMADRPLGSWLAMLAGATIHPFGAFGVMWLGLRWARQHQVTPRRLAMLALGLVPTIALLAVHTGGTEFTTRSTGVGHGIAPSALQVAVAPLASLVGAQHTQVQVAVTLFVLGSAVLLWPDLDLGLWILVPIAGIAVASYTLHPIWRVKYVGIVAPALAVGLVSNRPSWLRLQILAPLLGLVALGWYHEIVGVLTARRLTFWF